MIYEFSEPPEWSEHYEEPRQMGKKLPKLLLVTDLGTGARMVCHVVSWVRANREWMGLRYWLDFKAELLTAWSFPARAAPRIGGGAGPMFKVELCDDPKLRAATRDVWLPAQPAASDVDQLGRAEPLDRLG